MGRVAAAVLSTVALAGMFACAKVTPVVDVPLPVATTPAGAASMAVIPVHVTYVLRSLRPSLDSLFPPRDSINAPQCTAVGGLLCHQYVYRRDSLALKATGDKLQIETKLQYRAQLGMLGSARLASCGYQPEQMRRATLTMSTALYWRRDWRIGARESQLQATLLDQCLVTMLGMNATRALKDLLNRQLGDFCTAGRHHHPARRGFQTTRGFALAQFSRADAARHAGYTLAAARAGGRARLAAGRQWHQHHDRPRAIRAAARDQWCEASVASSRAAGIVAW